MSNEELIDKALAALEQISVRTPREEDMKITIKTCLDALWARLEMK